MSTILPAPAVRPASRRTRVSRRGAGVLSVLVLAGVMAFADDFLLTALQGAVGSIARVDAPFASWLRDSTLLLPVFALAVLGALAVAHRLSGPVLSSPRQVLGAALLVAVAGSVVGFTAIAASSAYDYRLQSEQVLHSHHGSDVPTAGHVHDAAGCSESCVVTRQDTLAVHERALEYAAPVVVVTNLVLVGWVVAARGGRIEPRTGRRTA